MKITTCCNFNHLISLLNHLECKGNSSATSNSWYIGLDGWAAIYVVQRGGDWAGLHCIAVYVCLLCDLNVPLKG